MICGFCPNYQKNIPVGVLVKIGVNMSRNACTCAGISSWGIFPPHVPELDHDLWLVYHGDSQLLRNTIK